MNEIFEKYEINIEKISLQKRKKENFSMKSMGIILEEETLQFSNDEIDNLILPTLYSTNFKSENEKDLNINFNYENIKSKYEENNFKEDNENNNNLEIIDNLNINFYNNDYLFCLDKNTTRRSKTDLAFDIPMSNIIENKAKHKYKERDKNKDKFKDNNYDHNKNNYGNIIINTECSYNIYSDDDNNNEDNLKEKFNRLNTSLNLTNKNNELTYFSNLENKELKLIVKKIEKSIFKFLIFLLFMFIFFKYIKII
jgi:hypothetical protein